MGESGETPELIRNGEHLFAKSDPPKLSTSRNLRDSRHEKIFRSYSIEPDDWPDLL